jgi:hypothetical protein
MDYGSPLFFTRIDAFSGASEGIPNRPKTRVDGPKNFSARPALEKVRGIARLFKL